MPQTCSFLHKWWKYIGCLLIAWQFYFIAWWYSKQVYDSVKYEYGSLPPVSHLKPERSVDLHRKQLRSKHGGHNRREPTATNISVSMTSTNASQPLHQRQTEKPHLVICAKMEEYLLPIAKYFEIHRLIDGYNGVPPWNATTLLLIDDPLCAKNPYIEESIRKRLESPILDTSSYGGLNGKWKHGVYFPNTKKKFMRAFQNRPFLVRARGEVFWRYSDTNCNDVDFIFDRQVETPADECFTIHYLQGVSGAYSRTTAGELGINETSAIYEGKSVNPQRPKDGTLKYNKFCSFLIRSDPDDLMVMFQEKNYDVDVLVRHMFYKQLSEYKPCDRVKECPGNPITAYKCFAGYKFHITMENSLVDGYISEKVFNGILGGGIPIYFGASDVGSYINKKSILHCNVNRSVIEEMRSFYPRVLKEKRRFLLNNSSSWPTQQQLLDWADGYLRNELKQCAQKVIELDTNDTAYKEVLDRPFVTNHDIMDGMYPLRGIKLAQDALKHLPSL